LVWISSTDGERSEGALPFTDERMFWLSFLHKSLTAAINHIQRFLAVLTIFNAFRFTQESVHTVRWRELKGSKEKAREAS
jgi:hypothetical protein